MRQKPGRVNIALLLILILLVMSARTIFWTRPLSLATAWQNSYPIIGRARPRWNSLHGYTANTAGGRDHCLRRIFSSPTTIRTFYGGTVKCWQQKQEQNQQSPPIPSAFSSSSWEVSEWAVHVAILSQDAPIKATDAIEKALKDYREESKQKGYSNSKPCLYSAAELLELGSVWYLPAEDMGNPYKKPTRLTTADADFLLKKNDYLRIHHNPRRFPAVNLYDWSLNSIYTQSSPIKKSVVVDHDPDKGYLVLNKPSECIPVHATVDNHAENMVSCLRQANPDLDYVVTPHRLDQNTSGLITLATSKAFAAYYAQVLRHKTASKLPGKNNGKENVSPTNLGSTVDKDQGQSSTSSGIHKVYRCLVCLTPPPSTEHQDNSNDAAWSVDWALKKLQLYAKDETIIRHYLEPSVRAPKRFVATLPPNANTTINSGKSEAGWAECLMRIQSVGDVCALRGNAASDELASALWNSTQEVMPPSCQAVVELEVELLTGRTHQIRGQLSAEGYPLVGDFPYGGCAVAAATTDSEREYHENMYDTRLALQCSQLEFLDPDIRVTHKVKKGHVNEIVKMMPSTRWNEYQLDSAWWTPYLRQYSEAMTKTSQEDMTTLAAMDIGLVETSNQQPRKEKNPYGPQNPLGLPPQAILSAGRNKYVLVKAIDPNTSSIHKWFVKSASPQECGGPYHRDVAADLVEWIEACGYRAVVTGGGRILYQPDTKRALVYGFSYGFGRGDHALAARVIKKWSQGGIDSAYDDSAELY